MSEDDVKAIQVAVDMVRNIADDIQDYDPKFKNTRDMLHLRADDIGRGIDALLAERERLQAVVEAARALLQATKHDLIDG